MSAWIGGLTDWIKPGLSGQQGEQDTSAGASARTGGSNDQEPVVVWTAANEMEAQIVKGRLISEEIPAILRGESLGTIYGLTAGRLASTDVLVPAPLADKARQILESDADWQDGEWGESSV